MKTLASVLLLFTIISIISISPSAFAAEVSVPEGSGVPGCEETDECWFPSVVTVAVGETVTWSNDDTAAHTVTSGTAVDGPDGIFDSSLFMAGSSFEATFDEAGTFEYFCMVHPWMQGLIIVQEAAAEPEITMATVVEPDQMMAEIMTSDGIANEIMTIDLTITDLEGNGVEHITYNIKAVQGTNTVLDEEGHMHKGTITNNHVTSALPVDASDEMPVVITVESVGFGHNEQYVEFSGEIVTKQVVPEFGTIAMMILVVAIISIVAVTAKSRLNIMPRI